MIETLTAHPKRNRNVKNLTTQQVMQLAQVSHMTVYTWRQGAPTKSTLPSVAGSRPRSVEFDPRVLKAWAFNNGVHLLADPVDVAKGKVILNGPTITVVKETATKPDLKSKNSKQIPTDPRDVDRKSNRQKVRH
jgi:hypothetical protein